MKKLLKFILPILPIIIFAVSCNKPGRPALGDYPKDTNPPGGPLKFYTAFDGTSTDPLKNAVDSIRANFPSDNPLSFIQGISGRAVQGKDQKAIKYPSANDFAKSTSFTVAFWEKNSVPTGGSPQWIFSLVDKDYWHNSGMFAFVDHDGAGSNATGAVVKFAVEDHWFEFTPSNGLMPGNLLNNSWHHLAFVYDETTSKMTYYVDGQVLTGLKPALTDFKDNGAPHGKINLNPESVSNLVVGGWNKQAGLKGPSDPWIQSWQGGLDQFRLYSKALSASDILALFNTKM